MKLKPVIASYSGASYDAISAFLDEGVIEVVSRVAASPVPAAAIEPLILRELCDMHVVRVVGDLCRLDTSVFLENDISAINAAASVYAQALSAAVVEAVPGMREETPAITLFVVGILGLGQCLGRLLRQEGVAVDWRSFSGRYGQSKVDFHEICDAQAELGSDLLNKTILRGTAYTAVFMGPGGAGFQIRNSQAPEVARPAAYSTELNRFLTDAYAMLIVGKLEHPGLRAAAEIAGLYQGTEPLAPVLSAASAWVYEPIVKRLDELASVHFLKGQAALEDLLKSTTAGRQGVPTPNMMLNLFRYLRRATAKELTANGLFRVSASGTGVTTLFYENSAEWIDKLFR